jgi:glutamyl-tRNA synthetase
VTLRVRFAPSPTGYLHVGGARTALFNWLLARREGGVFVLRIEDTDRERSSEAHTRAILHGLQWLGVTCDEGPYFQSEGLERHRADALALLESGRAYRDFSTPEEAARDKEEQVRLGGRSRRARERADAMTAEEVGARLAAGAPFAIRLRVPEGETVWQDGVHGETRFRNEEIDDLVILRSDRTPTYNLAVVSDDVAMGITLVMRGDDHLSNTPKQILLYQGLGKTVPAFAHVPMILGADGKRLSKRHGATAVGDYEKDGILAEAMVNFLALLGWSPGDDRELLSREELIAAFSVERVLRKSSVFDLEKLQWLNGQHLMRTPTASVLGVVEARLREEGAWGRAGAGEGEGTVPTPPSLPLLVELLKPRSRTLEELVRQALPYFRDPVELDPAAVGKHWLKAPEETLGRLAAVRDALAEVVWEAGVIEERLRTLAEELGVAAGKLFQPLRVALTGADASPGIFDVLVLLGRDRSLGRLERALVLLKAQSAAGGGGKKTLS